MSNSYLTSDGVLIDAGARADAVLNAARLHGVEVKLVLITHYHVDHIRYLADIVKATGAKVAAPDAEADVIEGRARPQLPGAMMRLIYLALRPRPTKVDIRVRDGDSVMNYRAVWAPGHTPGSTAYVVNDVMFSGDAVVSTRGRPSLPSSRFTLDQGKAEESFRRLLGLRPRIIYPGHGPPITQLPQ